MKKKKLPIGISDFKEIIEGNFYYVDKSLFIQEILDNGSKVILLTRPRRFGKTLNLMMLKYWYEAYQGKMLNAEIGILNEEKETIANRRSLIDNSELFHNLKIWTLGEEYTSHCGKYPVIFLTFKDVKEENWKNCYEKLQGIIISEFQRHKYLLESKQLDEIDKEYFQRILKNTERESDYKEALKNLSKFLHLHYGQKVVILIDEYDTPVHEAFHFGYYEKVINFLRTFLGAGLKDNVNLEKGVITGILRVARENLFSDLNNLSIYTVLSEKYSDKFGMLESEVKQILKDYSLEENLSGVKDWYDGYTIGAVTDVYNPWSILNYVDNHEEGLKPYWVNTSGNKMIKDLLAKGDNSLKIDLESLIQNKTIEKRIQSHTIFTDLERSSDSVWTLFLFSGYLKVIGSRVDEEDMYWCTLAIPNREVIGVYKQFILQWLSDYLSNQEVELFIKSLTSGDVTTFEEILQKYVLSSMSYFDVSGTQPEKVYHAFVLGLLVNMRGSYSIKSNAESGYGRYDISLIPSDKSQKGIIIEFKSVNVKRSETLDDAVKSALAQIEEKQYESELRSLGVTDILKLGIAFEGKKIQVGANG
ncbi:MAG: AAA family ATPase [Leptospiraceae bacterium]|nr:AAA family ATPase [Leptospiraceae bacterium]